MNRMYLVTLVKLARALPLSQPGESPVDIAFDNKDEHARMQGLQREDIREGEENRRKRGEKREKGGARGPLSF